MYCLEFFKAFALTGRQTSARNNPGRCPGLGASALSGRVAQNRAYGAKTGRMAQNRVCGAKLAKVLFIINYTLFIVHYNYTL